MSGPCDEGEEKRARQLIAHLEDPALPAADGEAAALADFTRSLPWPRPAPSFEFRARLRRELMAQRAIPRPGLFRVPAWLLGGAGVLVVVLIVGFALVSLSGPRISAIFGSVYNSLGSAAEAPALPTVLMQATPVAVMETPFLRATPVPLPSPTAPAEPRLLRQVEMALLVADAAVAGERLAAIAGQAGGQVLSVQPEEGSPALVVLSVPVSSLEQALQQIRGMAVQVEREWAGTEDVTAEYEALGAQERTLAAAVGRLDLRAGRAGPLGRTLALQVELRAAREQLRIVRREREALEQGMGSATIVIHLR